MIAYGDPIAFTFFENIGSCGGTPKKSSIINTFKPPQLTATAKIPVAVVAVL